jgi:CRP/FNR family transcriptional regulator
MAAGGTMDGRFTRRRIRRGESVYRMGESFHALYVLRSGTLKSLNVLADGRDQVTAFHMSGDQVGFDGIAGGHYRTDCIALEDSEVCVLPYDQVMRMAQTDACLLRELMRAMSAEIVREQETKAWLGTMQAEERVLAFLCEIGRRMAARGFSSTCLVLRITRAEIGSYLGLKLETVSRVITRLRDSGAVVCGPGRQLQLVRPTQIAARFDAGQERRANREPGPRRDSVLPPPWPQREHRIAA